MLPNLELQIPPEAHTLAGFRAWVTAPNFPENGRFCFLNGEIFIDMSPEEIQTHAKAKFEVCRGLENLNRKADFGELYPDGTLVTNEEANLSTMPDGTFALWETLEARRVQMTPRQGHQGQFIEVVGTPDWVLEVVSRSSVRKDTQRLRERYHRAGIPEYWLIDARSDEIGFEILVRGEADYEPARQWRGWQFSPVFRRRFRLVRSRNRLGTWVYELQVKPAR